MTIRFLSFFPTLDIAIPQGCLSVNQRLTHVSSSPTECRPCTEEELLRLYCSGDFVARGSILAVTDKPRLELTSLTIRASKIFQQTYPVFGHGHAHPHRTGTERGTQNHQQEEEEDDNDISFSSLVEEGSYVGRVMMPLQCGARWGDGEFLVMGVMRLGQPILQCAPRYEEWLALTRRAQNQAQCILESWRRLWLPLSARGVRWVIKRLILS